MATPGRVDYHVHYHLDGCADGEMTLPNIAREAVRLGLEEICVVKHYSERLPNGGEKWAHWKRVDPDAFDTFTTDLASFEAPPDLRILAGVETEIVDDRGGINVPEHAAQRVDAVILSVHWLPSLPSLPVDGRLWPGDIDRESAEAAVTWRARVHAAGASAILQQYVAAYTRAIERNPKVRILGHMHDGLRPLRTFEVPVDELDDAELTELMGPLMTACTERAVLWELTNQPVERPCVLETAERAGVRFCATVDAHVLVKDNWSRKLRDHFQAERYIESLGLTKGVVLLEP